MWPISTTLVTNISWVEENIFFKWLHHSPWGDNFEIVKIQWGFIKKKTSPKKTLSKTILQISNPLKPRSPPPPSHSLLSPKKSLNFQQLKKKAIPQLIWTHQGLNHIQSSNNLKPSERSQYLKISTQTIGIPINITHFLYNYKFHMFVQILQHKCLSWSTNFTRN